jgi:MFS family permease
MAAILAGTATVALDSAVNIDFPRIVARFDLPITEIRWLVISYTLASASLVLVFGRLGDIVGHRRVFLAGAGWSALAFLICAAAPSFGWLLLGRTLQGVGAGLVLSCGPALVASLYPDALRARGLAAYTAGFGWAGALGPVLGGAMLARFDWSCVFWVRAPLAAAALLLALGLPAAPPSSAKLREFDLLGAVLLTAGLGGVVVAAGTLRQPAWAMAAAALAAICAVLFVRQERAATAPVIRLGLFGSPGFALLNAGSLLINLAGFAVLLLAPFALSRMAGLSEPLRGVMLAASPAAIALAAPLAGRRLAAGGRGAVAAAALVTGIGLGMCAWALAAPLGLVAGMAITGIGAGVFQVAYLDFVTGAMPAEDRGVAGSLAMLTRSLGIVLGAGLLMQVVEAVTARGGDMNLALAIAFAAAAALPAGVGTAWLLRPPVRARST